MPEFQASSSQQVVSTIMPTSTPPILNLPTGNLIFSEYSEFTDGELLELDRMAGEKQDIDHMKMFVRYDNILYITFKNYSEFTWKGNGMHVLSRNASYVISRFGHSWNALVDIANFIGEESSFYHYLFRISKKITKYIKDHDIAVVFADIPVEIAKHLKFFNTFGEAEVYVSAKPVFSWKEL